MTGVQDDLRRGAGSTACTLVLSDARTLEHRVWPSWLREVGRSRLEFDRFTGTDPLSNETASVAVLAAAAARAGLLTSAEYACGKHQQDRRRHLRNGRADLWVGSPGHRFAWAFEAKQVHCRPGVRLDTLEKAMDRAVRDADDLDGWEADRFYGLLIATFAENEDCARAEERLTLLAGSCWFAWRCDGRRPAWLLFRRARGGCRR